MSPACMRIFRTTFTLQSYITLQQVSRLSSWSRSPSDLIDAGAASLTKRLQNQSSGPQPEGRGSDPAPV